MFVTVFFFFQAEDGIRDLVRSRGLGDVYKRQASYIAGNIGMLGADYAGYFPWGDAPALAELILRLSLIHI